MKKAKMLTMEDLALLQKDENGDYIIPEGVEIYFQAEKLTDADLAKLAATDADGNFVIPEGIQIYFEPDPNAERLARIAELEAQIIQEVEPTTEELIELGKLSHPYYQLVFELEALKAE